MKTITPILLSILLCIIGTTSIIAQEANIQSITRGSINSSAMAFSQEQTPQNRAAQNIYTTDPAAPNLKAISFSSSLASNAPKVGDKIRFTSALSNRLIEKVEVALYHSESDQQFPITLEISMYSDCPSPNSNTQGLACGTGAGTLIPGSTMTLPDFLPPNGAYLGTFDFPVPVNAYGYGDEITVMFKAVSISTVYLVGNTPIQIGSTPNGEPGESRYSVCGEMVQFSGCNQTFSEHSNNNILLNILADTDTSPPTAICKDITATLNPVFGTVTVSANAINNGSFDGEGSVTLSSSKTSFDCSDIGVNLVTLTVTDRSGLTSTCEAKVTIQESDIVINCPSNTVLEMEENCTTQYFFDTIITGNQSCNPITVTQIEGPGNGSFLPLGVTTFTYKATNPNGDYETCSYTVTVVDTTPPVIDNCAANITITNDPGVCGAVVNFVEPSIADTCLAFWAQVQGLPSGSLFPLGTTTNTYSAVDFGGNQTICSFTITVTGESLINCVADTTKNTDPDQCTYTVTSTEFDATFNSPCGGTIKNNLNNTATIAGEILPIGNTSVVWTLTLTNGQEFSCTTVLTIEDDQAPTITCPSDITVEPMLEDCEVFVTVPKPTFSDNCSSLGCIQTDDIELYALGPILGQSPNWQTWVPNTISQSGEVSIEQAKSGTKSIKITGLPSGGPVDQVYNLGNRTSGKWELSYSLYIPSGNTAYTNIQKSETSGLEFANEIAYFSNGNGRYSGNGTITNFSFPNDTWFEVKQLIDQNSDLIEFFINGISITSHPFSVKEDGSPGINQLGSIDFYPNSNSPGETNPAAIPLFYVDDISLCSEAINNYNNSSDASDTYPIGTTNVIWTVTDDAGNTANCTQLITVNDNVVPTISCPAPIIQNNDLGVCGAIITYTAPVGTDNCTSSTTQIAGLPSGSLFPVGTTTNTFEVTDTSGNTTSCSFNITINDTEAPTIVCQDITVQLDASGMVTIIPENVIADIILSDMILVSTTGNNSSNNSGTTDFTVPVSLAENLSFDWSYTTDDDPEYDTFGYLLNGIYTQLTDSGGALNQSGSASIMVNPGDEFGFRSYTVDNTYGAATSMVTNFAPGFTGQFDPLNWILTLVNSDGTANMETTNSQIIPNVFDNCGIASTAINVSDFTCANVGPNTVTVTVTDVNGNIATCIATVTVEDNEDPVISCIANDTRNTDSGLCQYTIVGMEFDATFTDNCTSGNITNDLNGTDTLAGEILPKGNTTIVWTVDDGNGQTATCTTVITVEDNEDPVITCATTETRDTDPGLCQYTVVGTEFDAIFLDNCSDGNITNDLNGTDTIAGTVLPKGITTVIWTVDDGNGQTANCTTVITVEDNEDPIITCAPNGTRDTDPGLCQYTVIGTEFDATFIDNCSDGIITNDFNGNNTLAGAIIPKGANTIIWTADDSNGQTVTCTIVITVEDNKDPVITCAPDGTRDTDPSLCHYTVMGTEFDATFTDNCNDGSITNDFNGMSTLAGAIIPKGVNTIIWLLDDGNGQTATCSTVITVEDNEAPAIVCPMDITVNTDVDNCSALVHFPTPMTLDNCGVATVIQTMGDPSGSPFPVGQTTIEFIVTDVNGNHNTCSFTITVVDNEAPMAVCQNITIQLDANGNASIGTADVDDGSTDPCGVTSTTIDIDTFDCSHVGDNNVILTVTDVNGNTSTCTSIVTVEDITAPVVACQDITVELDPVTGIITLVGTDIDNGSTDACGIASYDLDIDTFDCSNIGDNTVVLTVTDVNGNSASCTAIVTIEDNTSPQLVCQDFTIEIGADGTSTLTPSDVIASNDDACGILTVAVDITEFSCTDIGTPITVQVFSQDNNGNLSTCTATITAVDLLAPVISCPADQTVDPGAGNLFYIVPDYFATGEANAIDNCTDLLTVFTQVPAPETALSDGTYTINLTATDEYGNVGSCDFELTVDSVLGAGDYNYNLGSITIYPVPTRHLLNLGNPQGIELERLEIYDLRGRLVQTEDLRSMGALKSIDVEKLEAATYMLRIKGKHTEIIKRLLKE